MSVLPTANDAMRAKILNALDLSENRIKDDITKLRHWLSKQPHLPQNIDDNFLRSFIYGTKSLESAKDKLDRYFSVKNAFPTVFTNRDPTKFSYPESIEHILIPSYSKEGYSVYILRTRPDLKADNFNHLDVVKRQLLFTDYLIAKGFETAGFISVYDIGSTTAAHLTKFNLSHNNAALKCYEDNYPIKIKKMVLLNAPNFCVTMFNNLIKPLMKPKMANKFVLISSSDSAKFIWEGIPEESIPKEYGGKGPTCAELNERQLKLLESEKDWCIESENLKSNEKKRIEKSKYDFSTNYGVEGTFRSLALD